MLACLYDVHGNMPALEAVLADARAQGADRYLLGGDYALIGGWPAEVLDALEALEGPMIRGNADRWVADPHGAPDDAAMQAAIVFCREALGAARADALADLPPAHSDGATLYVHASPASDMQSFFPEPAPDEPGLLEGISARRVVFGHTHLAFARQGPEGIELVNPGSVGMPLDGDTRAAYALIHEDGRVVHRRVAYDHESAARRIEGAFPGAERFAARVRRAQMEDG